MKIEGNITCEEAIQYYRKQLQRAEINLSNANSRGDVRAVNNLNRKILIYRFTIEYLSNN